MCSHEDFIPTFAAAAGESQIVQKLRKGHEIGHRTYKVHLDGQNLLPFFKGDTKESPRKGFMYWSDDGFSKNRRAKASRCGNAISPICVFPIYITFEQIPSNAATKASSTKSGWQTVCSFKFRRRQSQPSGWQASRNFLHARNRQASTSTA